MDKLKFLIKQIKETFKRPEEILFLKIALTTILIFMVFPLLLVFIINLLN